MCGKCGQPYALQSRAGPWAVRPHQVNQLPTIDLWPRIPAASRADRQRAGVAPPVGYDRGPILEGFPGLVPESRSSAATFLTAGTSVVLLVRVSSCIFLVCLSSGLRRTFGGSCPYFLCLCLLPFLACESHVACGCVSPHPRASITSIMVSMGVPVSWGTTNQQESHSLVARGGTESQPASVQGPAGAGA